MKLPVQGNNMEVQTAETKQKSHSVNFDTVISKTRIRIQECQIKKHSFVIKNPQYHAFFVILSSFPPSRMVILVILVRKRDFSIKFQ